MKVGWMNCYLKLFYPFAAYSEEIWYMEQDPYGKTDITPQNSVLQLQSVLQIEH